MRCGCGRLISRHMKGKCMACRYKDITAGGYKACKICGKLFKPHAYNQVCCSQECSEENRLALIKESNYKRSKAYIVKCQLCRKEIVRHGRSPRKYCPECAAEINRERAKRNSRRRKEALKEAKANRPVPVQAPVLPDSVPAPAFPGSCPDDAWMDKAEPVAPAKEPKAIRLKIDPRRLPKPPFPATKSVKIGEVVPIKDISSMVDRPMVFGVSADRHKESSDRGRQNRRAK